MEPLSGFEPKTPGLGIQRLNHQAIASTPDSKVLGSNHNYMLDQALGPNLIPRLSGTFASIKQDCLPTYQVDQGWPWDNQIFP